MADQTCSVLDQDYTLGCSKYARGPFNSSPTHNGTDTALEEPSVQTSRNMVHALHSDDFHRDFFWVASTLANPKLSGSSSVIPSSTLMAVELNSAMVSPWGWRMRGCQPSGRRSSNKIVRRSLTLPPKIVSRVDELQLSKTVSSMHNCHEQKHILRTTKEPLEGGQAELRVVPLRFRAPLARDTRKVGRSQVTAGTRSACQQFFNLRYRLLALIGANYRVFPYIVSAGVFCAGCSISYTHGPRNRRVRCSYGHRDHSG